MGVKQRMIFGVKTIAGTAVIPNTTSNECDELMSSFGSGCFRIIKTFSETLLFPLDGAKSRICSNDVVGYDYRLYGAHKDINLKRM